MRSFYRLLTELSSIKWISQLTGRFAKSAFSKRFIPHFIKTYGIRADEAEKELHEYPTLNDFFIRKLKTGSRRIDPDEDAIISPVDGTLTAFGAIEEGMLLNIKGQDYNIDELLNQSPRTVSYKHGFYFILYLSPSDYHRIHAPITAQIVENDHIPGRCFPVNQFGMKHVSKVLCRNERKITYLHHPSGDLALIKVGALNVSGIQYEDGLQPSVTKGDPLAYFEFGSTVVMLLEKDMFESDPELELGQHVRMGQRLGRLHNRNFS